MNEVSEWWAGFTGRLDWDDPVLLLTALTVLVTALIPLFIWRLGLKQASRDSEVRRQQAASLDRQEQILRRQRRDALLTTIDQSTDKTHLMLLWAEVQESVGQDGWLLRAVFRANVSVALPGTHVGNVRVADELDDQAVSDYVAGLDRRFSGGERGFHSYNGLLDFVRHARMSGVAIDVPSIVRLVTGPTVKVQRPGHQFYRDLVNLLPEAASGLLAQVEGIDYRNSGGSRLNVLTGALLGIKDAELRRFEDPSAPHEVAMRTLRNSVPVALAQLLHRDNLRSLDRWSLEGSTEPVSATIAWLIRTVGWLSDADVHLVERMVQNLSAAIKSIPQGDRGWGVDAQDVYDGLRMIEEKQQGIWAIYGADLEAAASAVGEWQ